MLDILHEAAAQKDIFSPLPKFATSRKPSKKSGEYEEFISRFSELKDYVKSRYDKLYEGLSDRQSELSMFLESGRCAGGYN